MADRDHHLPDDFVIVIVGTDVYKLTGEDADVVLHLLARHSPGGSLLPEDDAYDLRN
jgi:hypothetical protein